MTIRANFITVLPMGCVLSLLCTPSMWLSDADLEALRRADIEKEELDIFTSSESKLGAHVCHDKQTLDISETLNGQKYKRCIMGQ